MGGQWEGSCLGEEALRGEGGCLKSGPSQAWWGRGLRGGAERVEVREGQHLALPALGAGGGGSQQNVPQPLWPV